MSSNWWFIYYLTAPVLSPTPSIVDPVDIVIADDILDILPIETTEDVTVPTLVENLEPTEVLDLAPESITVDVVVDDDNL